ncbi:hypothetical protein GCM10010145_38200 [Streptomyces ruber]|uniref:Uncharacterized protein n=2 Tax=Streptomyces TaxID=1883 RepID=A0A918BFC7_9ACTN|nr:DUF6243 family protein [Streptomyces ruber]GGQ64710.1 hypothetical protein GCM10010145_38200 [Streptomyces ruber]
MARNGSGNMPGVGGTRSGLGRKALCGGGRNGHLGGGQDPAAQKRELLRKLREQRGEGRADGDGDGDRR